MPVGRGFWACFSLPTFSLHKQRESRSGAAGGRNRLQNKYTRAKGAPTRLQIKNPTPEAQKPQTFSNGLNNHRQSAGKKINAANIFTTNINVSINPISAWNFSSEKIHIATPTANVNAV